MAVTVTSRQSELWLRSVCRSNCSVDFDLWKSPDSGNKNGNSPFRNPFGFSISLSGFQSKFASSFVVQSGLLLSIAAWIPSNCAHRPWSSGICKSRTNSLPVDHWVKPSYQLEAISAISDRLVCWYIRSFFVTAVTIDQIPMSISWYNASGPFFLFNEALKEGPTFLSNLPETFHQMWPN